MANVNDLKEFINYAEKNRKYASETAKGRRAALKVFEDELSEEEKSSIDIFADRFDKIYNAVFQKNKQTITASSLKTYMTRVKGLIKDYKKYGSDPNAFSAWDTTRHRAPKPKSEKHASNKKQKVPVSAEIIDIDTANQAFLNATNAAGPNSSSFFSNDVNKFEVHLRSSFRVSLVLPNDLKQKEADRLKQIIDGMVTGDEQA